MWMHEFKVDCNAGQELKISLGGRGAPAAHYRTAHYPGDVIQPTQVMCGKLVATDCF